MTDEKQHTSWQLRDMHHLGLTVSDIERSIHFYRDMLGMQLIRRRPKVAADYVSKQTGYEGLELSVASFNVSDDGKRSGGGKPSLEIVQYVNNSGPPGDPATNRSGSSHLCLLVDDLRSCYDDLLAQGVRFRSEPVTITSGPNEGGLVVYLCDPDGYTIEMFQPGGPISVS